MIVLSTQTRTITFTFVDKSWSKKSFKT